jgi:hypothetical protein
MNDRGKSDGPVLPVKPPNKPAVVAGAEVVEGKAPDNRHEKGNERSPTSKDQASHDGSESCVGDP